MREHDERPFEALSKAERIARVVGNALQQDEEEIGFWRAASDEMRGRTLHRLLLQGRYISAAVPDAIAPYEDRMRLILKPKKAFIMTDYE